MLRIIFLILLSGIGYSQTNFYNSNLTGNWFGLRDSLAEKGINLDVVYTSDIFSNLYGGLERKTTYLDNFDIIFTFNLKKLIGFKNSNIFIYGLGNDGEDPDNYIGDAQTASNIAAPSAWKIFEAWIQTDLFDNRISLLAGLYNLNSEFENLQSSNLFINSSHGIGVAFSQTGENGPSIFPTTSVGVRLKTEFNNSYYLQAVVLDGVPGDSSNPKGTHIIFNKKDGMLITVETGLISNSANTYSAQGRAEQRRLGRLSDEEYSFKYALGFWKYTSEFNELISLQKGNLLKSKNNIGMYFIGEQTIFSDPENDARNLKAFLRLETANAKINRFGYYIGGGLVFNSPFLGRPDDQLGIAFANAVNGFDYNKLESMNNQPVSGSELNFELTYYVQFFPWFSVQPDVQYIVNPDTNPLIQNSLCFDVRISVTF